MPTLKVSPATALEAASEEAAAPDAVLAVEDAAPPQPVRASAETAEAAIAAFRKLRREIMFMVFIAVAPSLERAAYKIKTRSTCGTGFCSRITKRPCPCVFIHKDRVEKFESAVPPCLLCPSSLGSCKAPHGEPTLPCPVTEASVPSYWRLCLVCPALGGPRISAPLSPVFTVRVH